MTEPRSFEPLGGRTVFDGHVVHLRVERFRFSDGEEVEREIVRHPGAVAIVAHDGEHVFLVRQPRPAVGDPDSLELPAGLLDHAGEPPLETAKRELKEEIGQAAATWEHLHSYFSSVGTFDEQVHVFLATDLTPEAEDSGENERIELVAWPLAELDAAISSSRDGKTIIGLQALRAKLG